MSDNKAKPTEKEVITAPVMKNLPKEDARDGVQHIEHIARKRLDDLIQRMGNPELYKPISFGIKELDEAAGGVVLPSFIAIGGPKKIGKTVVATHLAAEIAKSGRETVMMIDGKEHIMPVRVLTFHLEETRWQYADRLMTAIAPTTTRPMIRDLTLTEANMTELENAVVEMSNWELYMDDSTFDIATMIKMAKDMFCQVIIIDTFGLIRGGKGSSVQEKLADVSRELLYARNKDGITSIVIHHKNRDGEDFGSDALGRDADLRISVSQPEDVIAGEGMEGVLRLSVENSRQAGGGQNVDVAASFSQNRIKSIATNVLKLPSFKSLI